jgi:hypothetical protein
MIAKSIIISVLMVSVTLILIAVTPKVLVYEAPAIKLHRITPLECAGMEWCELVYDFKVEDESNYGLTYDFTTGNIHVDVAGLYYVSGCLRPLYNGTSATVVQIGFRACVSKDGGATFEEKRCLQNYQKITRQSNDAGTNTFTGTIKAEEGDIIRFEYYTNNDDLVFIGWDGFDNPVSASIQLFKFSD